MVGVRELLDGGDVVEVRGQWLVENLQAAHGHPHISGERLMHGGVVQRQEYRHVWLQGGEGGARVILKEALRPCLSNMRPEYVTLGLLFKLD